MTQDIDYVFRAAQNNEVEKIKAALNDGIDINVTRKVDANKSMLHYAVNYSHLNLVNLLVENGINVNIVDKYGETALHKAVEKGAFIIVKTLIENGAQVDLKSNKKVTPFNKAIYSNEIECAEFLLKNGADIDNKYDSNYEMGMTSLHFAVGGSYDYSDKLVEFLIKHGANPNVKDDDNNLLLTTAIQQGTLTSQVIGAVSNINIQDKEGKTALHHAAANDSKAPLEKILKLGDVDFNIKDNEGKVPLYYSSNESIAALLIKKGAPYDHTKEYDDLFMCLYGEQHIDLEKLNGLIASGEEETFDVTKLINHTVKAIKDFAKKHQDETFYVFAIDGGLLCLNSEEAFEKTLKNYQTNDPKLYESKDAIESLKYNTGDFAYQGFSSFGEGFVNHYYDEHCSLPAHKQIDSRYAKAMDTILDQLEGINAFEPLKLSKDFTVIRVEHTY